jgi:hypothetical protein
LARRAGFDVLTPVDLEQFSSVVYSEQKVAAALALLQDRKIEPTMTADELLKMTRSE